MITLSLGLVAAVASGFVLALVLVGTIVAAKYRLKNKKQHDLEGFG